MPTSSLKSATSLLPVTYPRKPCYQPCLLLACCVSLVCRWWKRSSADDICRLLQDCSQEKRHACMHPCAKKEKWGREDRWSMLGRSARPPSNKRSKFENFVHSTEICTATRGHWMACPSCFTVSHSDNVVKMQGMKMGQMLKHFGNDILSCVSLLIQNLFEDVFRCQDEQCVDEQTCFKWSLINFCSPANASFPTTKRNDNQMWSCQEQVFFKFS